MPEGRSWACHCQKGVVVCNKISDSLDPLFCVRMPTNAPRRNLKWTFSKYNLLFIRVARKGKGSSYHPHWFPVLRLSHIAESALFATLLCVHAPRSLKHTVARICIYNYINNYDHRPRSASAQDVLCSPSRYAVLLYAHYFRAAHTSRLKASVSTRRGSR